MSSFFKRFVVPISSSLIFSKVHFNKNKNQPKSSKIPRRKKIFLYFASLCHKKEPFMTRADFIRSFLEDAVDKEPWRENLNETEVDEILKETHTTDHKNGSFLLTTGKSILSYADYIFLIAVQVRPQTVFKIMFDLLDKDGDGRINLEEFLILEKTINMNNTFEIAKTSLHVHFFGKEGEQTISYEDFEKFILQIQKDISWKKFQAMSEGTATIAEDVFAKYAFNSTNYNRKLLNRLDKRGITFKDFHHFCDLIKHLDDFSQGMRLIRLANIPLSPEIFRRLVKITTDWTINDHLLNVIFAIFDLDESGFLEGEEFEKVLRNGRLLAPVLIKEQSEFARCMRKEMNNL